MIPALAALALAAVLASGCSHDATEAEATAHDAVKPVAVTVAGIASDRLYPLRLQEELVELIPSAETLHVIESLDGHDGFLNEPEQVGTIIRSALR